MARPAPTTSPPVQHGGEQRIILYGVSWEQYVTVRDALSGGRMIYLEGALEIMTTSLKHEGIKKSLARLLETYAVEKGIALNGYGSTTFRRRASERGIEPDECYSLGAMKKVPDIAIEVIVWSGGLNRLDVYRGLRVPEVWFWQRGRLTQHQLDGLRYRAITRSRLLPDLDLEQLLSFVQPDEQTEAVRAYREALRQMPT